MWLITIKTFLPLSGTDFNNYVESFGHVLLVITLVYISIGHAVYSNEYPFAHLGKRNHIIFHWCATMIDRQRVKDKPWPSRGMLSLCKGIASLCEVYTSYTPTHHFSEGVNGCQRWRCRNRLVDASSSLGASVWFCTEANKWVRWHAPGLSSPCSRRWQHC